MARRPKKLAPSKTRPAREPRLQRLDRKPKAELPQSKERKGLWAVLSILFLTGMLGIIGWEDWHYRKRRDAMLTKADPSLSEKPVLQGRSSVGLSKSREYRQALRLAQGHLIRYHSDPQRNVTSLTLALSSLRIALNQVGDHPDVRNAKLKIQSSIDEVEGLMKEHRAPLPEQSEEQP